MLQKKEKDVLIKKLESISASYADRGPLLPLDQAKRIVESFCEQESSHNIEDLLRRLKDLLEENQRLKSIIRKA